MFGQLVVAPPEKQNVPSLCRPILQPPRHHQRQSQILHFLPAADQEPHGVPPSIFGRKKQSFYFCT